MKNILYLVIFTTFISCNFSKNEKNASENVQIVNDAINLADQQAAAALKTPTDTVTKKVTTFIPTKKEKKKSELQLSSAIQSFNINTARDTTIFGENRTRIFIPAHTFVDKKGNEITEEVAITLKECYKPIDIIKEKLSTVCNHRLLETEGMIYVEARHKNEKLQVKKGASIIVHFPKKEPNDKAEFFYGQKDAEGIVSWREAKEKLIEYELNGYGISYYEKYAIAGRRDNFPYALQNIKLNQELLMEMFNKKASLIAKYSFRPKQSIEVEAINSQDKNMVKKIKSACEAYFAENKTNNYKDIDSFFVVYSAIPTFTKNLSSNTAYKSSFKTKYYNTTIKDMEEAELNFYIFEANELGWINCDRFIESQEKRVDFVVETAEDFDGQVNVIFTDMKCAMAGIKKGNRYEFKNVPKNRTVKIVAMQQIDKQVSCAIEKVTISEKPVRNLLFKNMSMKELDVALEDVAKN